MADAAGEGPTAAEKVTAIHRHGFAEGREYPGRPGRIATNEDFLDGIVGKKSAHASHAGCANHQAPACRWFYLADGLQHVELGDQVCFCTAQHVGHLEAQEAGVV